MGVIVTLVAADDVSINRLIESPSDFQRFMMGGELLFETTEEKANYFRNGILPKSLQNAVRPRMSDMDKAWAAIDYLLAKFGDSSIRFISQGGREIRETPKKKRQPGWILARAFSAMEVAHLNNALSQIHEPQLVAQFDASELQANDVYPFGFTEPDLEYILHWYQVMREFVRNQVALSEGLLVTAG